MSELFDLLKEIEADFGVRVCVHDVSGITFTIPSLALPYLWKTHGGQYCTAAKKATSERACMRQKEIALHSINCSGTEGILFAESVGWACAIMLNP